MYFYTYKSYLLASPHLRVVSLEFMTHSMRNLQRSDESMNTYQSYNNRTGGPGGGAAQEHPFPAPPPLPFNPSQGAFSFCVTQRDAALRSRL
ncbi:hypothetical protein EVAR_89728_1 [Eumeta japonica]|uniref:Uncharacterized protein n=1 Tax=Eumeta variegata TaxID=151549 RepID=A0A4C1Y662_EUMVA|nr:hypothetical protein EVAR_89728_1 [Eumeta japonica]